MRILYIAHHRPGDWDEGAGISYAFEQLGHTVVRIPERSIRPTDMHHVRGDMLLFHHFSFLPFIAEARRVRPKVFWYFDLVDFPDPTLTVRCMARKLWMEQAVQVADIGFMNDGDWVNKDLTGKLHVLHEGADERFLGKGDATAYVAPARIVFVGSPNGGTKRMSCIGELQARYGAKFIGIGAAERHRVYQRDLANVLANVDITVAPDSPVTANYWSNRVYLMTAFGKFLIHPYCGNLDYWDGHEIVYYRSREELFAKIDWFLEQPEAREKIAAGGLKATTERHTYRHRLTKMLEIVEKWKTTQ